MNTFADIFKYLRLREGLSQRELAKKLKMSASAVGMYESGKRLPSREAEEAIADYFNVSLPFLRGYEEEPAPDYNAMVRRFMAYSEAMQKKMLAYADFVIKEESDK